MAGASQNRHEVILDPALGKYASASNGYAQYFLARSHLYEKTQYIFVYNSLSSFVTSDI